MTIKGIADILGVSVSTVTRAVKELFPELITRGRETRLNEVQATAVKMSLTTELQGVLGFVKNDEVFVKNDEVQKRVQFNAVQRISSRTQEDLIIQQAMSILQDRCKTLEVENAELKDKNVYLENQNSWLIAGHQKLGEEALKKYGGLPYWFNY